MWGGGGGGGEPLTFHSYMRVFAEAGWLSHDKLQALPTSTAQNMQKHPVVEQFYIQLDLLAPKHTTDKAMYLVVLYVNVCV